MENEDQGLIFLESGLPRMIPGLLENTPALAFPFWGGYPFMEYHLRLSKGSNRTLILADEQYNRELQRLTPLFREQNIKVFILEQGMKYGEIANIIENYPFKRITLVSTGSLAWWPPALPRGDCKYTVNHTPLDIYTYTRDNLLAHLKPREEDLLPGSSQVESFITNILDSHFDTLHETEGQIFFHNRVTDYYTGNLWFKNNLDSPVVQDFLKHSGELTTKQGVISSTGDVISSLVMPGAAVHGRVENSLIFKGVEIGRDSIIRDSVIMSGNKIAPHCIIEKALLLPQGEEWSVPNIKEGVKLGSHMGQGANKNHPTQITGGITLLGRGTVLPPGFKAGPGCYIPPGIMEKNLGEKAELGAYSSWI